MQPTELEEQPAEEMENENEVPQEETENDVSENEPIEKETSEEKNWRAVREELEATRRRNQELEYYLQQQNQMAQQANQNPSKPEPEEEIDDEELLTGAQAKKLASKLAREAAEKIVNEREKERQLKEAPTRLRQKMPDYDSVVNEETYMRFVKECPDHARAIDMLKEDPYAQGALAYDLLKARYKTNPSEVYTQMEKKRGEENRKKPVSSSAVPGRRSNALSNADPFANGLTPELKDQLWAEMQEYEKYR